MACIRCKKCDKTLVKNTMKEGSKECKDCGIVMNYIITQKGVTYFEYKG